jgi:hypothetical protein
MTLFKRGSAAGNGKQTVNPCSRGETKPTLPVGNSDTIKGAGTGEDKILIRIIITMRIRTELNNLDCGACMHHTPQREKKHKEPTHYHSHSPCSFYNLAI